MTQSSAKKLDLQGIRGLAILSVLGFHFYPNLFPNGYLGVDQFFVLSGFLMCMLLLKTREMAPLSAISQFYSRRFKRILPLYLLVIFFTLIALYTVFPETAVLQNELSATKALLFMSNRPHTGEEDYFEKLSIAIDLFTHTWSLSVEIQFYFLVPFIFLAASMFSEKVKYVYYFLLGVVSLSFFAISPETVAFNSVFARIWQFLIGMVTYMISVKPSPSLPYTLIRSDNSEDQKLLGNDDESKQRDAENVVQYCIRSFSKYVFLVPMVFTVAYPIALHPSFVRPLFTVFTSILILISVNDVYLSNRFLVYIGDISYALYMIHWPVYAYAKLLHPGNQYVLFGSLIAALLLSILIFETFEKWYLTLKNTPMAALIITLLAANMALINKDAVSKKPIIVNDRLDGVTSNMTVDDAIKANLHWIKHDMWEESLNEKGCIKRTHTQDDWCDYEENGTEFKIAMFGNSYAQNHHKMVIQECRHRAYNISKGWISRCEPLASNVNDKTCVRSLLDFVRYIESANADYVFMLTRFFAVGDPFEGNNTDVKTDRTYLEMKSQLKKFLPHIKKKLYILDSFPRANGDYTTESAKDLKKGVSLEDVNKKMYSPEGYERGRMRHAELMKECGGKCELIDYMPTFWNSTLNMTQYVDSRGFNYLNQGNHLSAHGLELVRPIYRKICESWK